MLARRIAALFVILAGAAACAALPPRLVSPSVELAHVRVARLAPDDTRVRLVLTVNNPNPRDLVVDALEAKVVVEGGQLATGTLAAPATLRAGADSRVEIDARTSAAAVVGVMDRVLREGRARYELSGIAVVGGARFTLARRGELPVGEIIGSRP
jgi:LEA14-like dessication related protein